jgi:hypothetical protein
VLVTRRVYVEIAILRTTPDLGDLWGIVHKQLAAASALSTTGDIKEDNTEVMVTTTALLPGIVPTEHVPEINLS